MILIRQQITQLWPVGLLLFCLASFSCDSQTAKEQSSEIVFSVDQALIGAAHIDTTHGLLFHPPKGWEAMPDSMLLLFNRKMQQRKTTDSQYQFETLSVFQEPGKNRVCFLSRIDNAPKDASLSDFIKDYLAGQKQKYKTDIKSAEFTVNMLPVAQLMIITQQTVIFEIIFKNKADQYLQLDYAVFTKVYPEVIKHIESSIGTLKLLD